MTLYDTHRDLVAELDSAMGQLDEADDRNQAVEVGRRVIRIAEKLVEAAPVDPDAHQMLGLAWYRFPGSGSWRSWHCRAALERALAIDPAHPWARKYLGYLLFDQERYGDALEHFDALGGGFFHTPNREWERLKLLELSLACRLRLAPTALPEGFATFCGAYVAARAREDEAVELGSTVPLQELPECAEWLLDQGADPRSTPLREILTFLHRYRSEVSFWNRAYDAKLAEAEESDIELRMSESAAPRPREGSRRPPP